MAFSLPFFVLRGQTLAAWVAALKTDLVGVGGPTDLATIADVGGGGGRTSVDVNPGAGAQAINASTNDVWNVDLTNTTADPPFSIGTWGDHSYVSVLLFLPDTETASITVTLPTLVVPTGADALAADYTIDPGGTLELLLTKSPATGDVIAQVSDLEAGTAPTAYRGADTTTNAGALTPTSGVQTDDTLIFISSAGGTSDGSDPTGGWDNTPAIVGISEIYEHLGATFHPSVIVWSDGHDGDATYTAGQSSTSAQNALLTLSMTASAVTHTVASDSNAQASNVEWGSGVTRAAGDEVFAYVVNRNGGEKPVATDPTDWERVVDHADGFNHLVVWRYTGSATGTITPDATIGWTGASTEQQVSGYVRAQA